MKKQASAWYRQATQMVQAANGQQDKLATMVEQLGVKDPAVSVPAIWALQQAGTVAIPVLLDGLTHPHTKVRRNCVDVIDHGGYGGDARCVEGLLSLLDDHVPHIRRAVWHTLFCERCQNEAHCEVQQPEPLDQIALLIEVGIHDANLKLRRQLTGTLCEHIADSRVRPALEQVLAQETDPEIRSVVQAALA
ncbi:MAG: HEAT repeat domain-containing protein [Chloroflexota bacterium]